MGGGGKNHCLRLGMEDHMGIYCNIIYLYIYLQSSNTSGVQMKPLHILYGHTAEVTTVAISVELDMVVTGAKVSVCYCLYLTT